MCLGSHSAETWSSTQRNKALSSAEAELYALVKGASQTKRLISLMTDWGYTLAADVCSDASAAIAISHRKGLGKMRHVEVQYLWVQDEVAEGRMKIHKVDTRNNPADLLTKALSREVMMRHLTALSVLISATRA